MGILDIFKKKAPGHCIACKDAVAKYRCPVCGKEYCEACVKRSAQTLEETAQAPRIKVSIVSGGVVNTGASRGIESRVQERIDAMRKITRKGGGVCLGCSVEKSKAIALKKL
jgi:GMP synthase-like glutamine amidotransferase